MNLFDAPPPIHKKLPSSFAEPLSISYSSRLNLLSTNLSLTFVIINPFEKPKKFFLPKT